MSFAEIILRVGASIGGWLTFIGHALTLSVLRQAACDPASDELWRGTLLFGVLAIAGLLFVGRGLPWRSAIRWLALPALALALHAGWQIGAAFGATTLDGASLCTWAGSQANDAAFVHAATATSLERIWPPFQLAVLAFGVVQAIRFWLGDPKAINAA
ncbi:MAG: hypothetical protein R3E53_19580 [Myxococcota bacterium]